MQIFIEMLVKLCVKNSIEFEHVWSCVTWIEPKALGQYTCTCLQVTHLRTLTTGSDDLWVTSTPHLLSILCTSSFSNARSNAPQMLLGDFNIGTACIQRLHKGQWHIFPFPVLFEQIVCYNKSIVLCGDFINKFMQHFVSKWLFFGAFCGIMPNCQWIFRSWVLGHSDTLDQDNNLDSNHCLATVWGWR